MDNSLCIGSITLGALSFADFFLTALQFIFIILSIILISIQILKHFKK
jgi:hypothetical protein|tara:strand:+ start:751 stop:894 length:144 start_codon:yes stop_codon:yes gene_type:complete